MSFFTPGFRSVLAATLLSSIVACGAASTEGDEASTPTSGETPATKTAALPEGETTNGDNAAPAPTQGENAAAVAMPYRGVNLAGGEFGSAIPGIEGRDYQWPTTDEVDYYLAKGMNTFRIGFKWERLQSKAYGELVPAYVAKLDALVDYATSKGATVILNPHNFARYYGTLVGSTSVPNAAFADLWTKIAIRHANDSHVIFNLVNEPNNMLTEQWVGAANAAIAGIRKAGAKNEIIVPGNAWTGAHSWNEDYYGTPNAVAMLDIVDPIDNVIFEVHQYLDATSGGTSPVCVSKTIGRERLQPFVNWLRQHGKKGFVGEFAGGDNELCNAAVKDMLESMMESSDVLVGWLWWAAGPAWTKGYPFSLDPVNGKDMPQMSLLAPHLFSTPVSP